MKIRACLVILLLLLGLPAQAAEKRLALVIGNSKYTDLPALTNPANDAHLIAKSLRQIGFTVLEKTDADQQHLLEAIRTFGDQLSAAGKDGVGFVYYAGHGVQANGHNYLIPVGATIRKETDLELSAVDVNLLTSQLESSGSSVNILVLDACRDNPFKETSSSSRGLSRSTGLAQMQTATSSLFLAYATAPGQAAQDGSGADSPYATALASTMLEPGLGVEEVFKHVRVKVLNDTQNKQVPWDSSSMQVDFYFKPPVQGQPAPAQPAPPVQVAIVTPPVDTTAGTFRDCPQCPEMVRVPTGHFSMGSPAAEAGRGDDESTQHTVDVPGFAIGKYAVTFDEWDACVAGNGCSSHPGDEGWGHGRRPVINVSWDDAQQYLRWLSARTGHIYRLPSESEWEYTARAGSAGAHYWGDDDNAQCRYANGVDASAKRKNPNWNAANCDDGYTETSPVGSFSPNAFGLFDMLGNVWQWVEDCYQDSYSGAPADGTARISCSGQNSDHRVLRGGAWFNGPRRLRAAARVATLPSARSYGSGFRVARAN